MTTEKTLTLPEWLQKATRAQRNEMYAQAGTSRRAIWQVAAGLRNMSAAKAAQVEQATIAISATSPGLPPVLRTSSCTTCATCPFALKCRGEA
jgi:hypothetical protein